MTTGKISGGRGRGIQRQMLMDGLRWWHSGISLRELIQNKTYGEPWTPLSFGRAHDSNDNEGDDE